ncbi:MAG: hypothetical protein EPN74_09430 [Rhodanobacter sp.]|nr:MAG: hypothetical protein EPN74_09430 [Rhodanobacter sp.]
MKNNMSYQNPLGVMVSEECSLEKRRSITVPHIQAPSRSGTPPRRDLDEREATETITDTDENREKFLSPNAGMFTVLPA